MKCYRCDRDMIKAAVSVPTQSGLAHLGPKCAVLSGLLKPARRSSGPRAGALFSRPPKRRSAGAAGLIQGDLFIDPETLEETGEAVDLEAGG